MIFEALERISRRKRLYAFLLFLITLTSRIGMLFLQVRDPDEAMYANAARKIMHGMVMYRDIVDQKPPFIYYFYSLCLALINDIRFIHFITIIIVWLTAMAIYRLVSNLHNNTGGVLAGILYVLSVSMIGQSSNTEIFMNMPIVFGILYFFSGYVRKGKRIHLLTSSILIGIASLIKQPAIFTIIPILTYVAIVNFRKEIKRLPSDILILTVGTILPYIPTLLYYWSKNALWDFIYWAYFYNFKYVELGNSSFSTRILAMSILIAIIASNLILWIYASTRIASIWKNHAKRKNGIELIFGIVWLVLSIFAVSMGHRFYLHYFIQLSPVLVFLAAPLMAEHLAASGRFSDWRKKIIIFFIVVPPLAFVGFLLTKIYHRGYECQKPYVVKTSKFIQSGTKNDDMIFTWGTPIISYLANRENSSRFVNCSFVFGNADPCRIKKDVNVSNFSNTKEFQQMMVDIKKGQPKFFVDTSPSNIHCYSRYPIYNFEPLQKMLRDNYKFAIKFNKIDIYKINFYKN